MLSTVSIANQADIGCREAGVASPPAHRENGGAVSSTINIRAAKVLFYLAGISGQDKKPSGKSRRATLHPGQNGASPDCGAASLFVAALGASASARLSRRTEFARTLQKTLNGAALAFLDLPFSRSYFELTSCPSTRTWSPLPKREEAKPKQIKVHVGTHAMAAAAGAR